MALKPVLLVVLMGWLGGSMLSASEKGVRFAASGDGLLRAYDRLPLSFTSNQGQADGRYAFVANGSGYSIALTRGQAEMTLVEQRPPRSPLSSLSGKHSAAEADKGLLRMTLPDSMATAAVTAVDDLAGRSNYLLGSDRAKWRINVPNFARVRYARVYPGVDMVFYGSQRDMEFDFVVAPYADPLAIKLRFAGMVASEAVQLATNKEGDLITAGEDSRVLLRRPVLYQVTGEGVKQQVDGSFVLRGTSDVVFRVGAYDHSRALVVDPVLVYSTFLGSKHGLSGISAVAVDNFGSAYVTGGTSTTPPPSSFPVTSGAYETEGDPADAIFISKFKPDGSGLEYSTFINPGTKSSLEGEAPAVSSSGIAVDGGGNAYIVGNTNTLDFPVTAGAYQTSFFGIGDPFVLKLNPSGSGLVYSTFLSGTARFLDLTHIAVDTAGEVYVSGETHSDGYPVTPEAFQTNPGPQFPTDPYTSTFTSVLTKLNATGSGLVYSTYFGGYAPNASTTAIALAVDGQGAAYLGGAVDTPKGFPVSEGAFSAVGRGFVAKFNPTGSGLAYATLLKSSEYPMAIAVDLAGSVYATGDVDAPDLPVTAGAYQAKCLVSILEGPDGEIDVCHYAFVQKLKPDGTGLLYSTYFGTGPAGNVTYGDPVANTTASAIAVDVEGNAYIAGSTTSQSFPVTSDAVQSSPRDPNDPYFNTSHAYLTKFNSTGSGLLYSTYLGAGDPYSTGVAVDLLGDAYVGGIVFKDGPPAPFYFPTTPGALQPTYLADTLSEEGFLSKFGFATPFCRFKSDLQVNGSLQRQQGFVLHVDVTLGATATPDFTEVPVSLVVGAETFTLPAGAFARYRNVYVYRGSLHGVDLSLVLGVLPGSPETSTCAGTRYSLLAIARGGDLGDTSTPVRTALALGENSGISETKAGVSP